MARHNTTGREGEQLAADWLAQAGYELLHRNWRTGRQEVDIIAAKEGILHFVEVKTLRSEQFGYPEQKVNRKKMEHLMAAAEAYLYEQPQWKRISFDIVAVTITGAGTQFLLLEDVAL